jgi:hypothetical protein
MTAAFNDTHTENPFSSEQYLTGTSYQTLSGQLKPPFREVANNLATNMVLLSLSVA